MKELVNFYNSTEEVSRREKSRKAWKIYDGNINQCVREYLKKILNATNHEIDSIPVISAVNVARSIVKEQCLLYTNAVKREFGVDSDEFEIIYKKIKADNLMLEANRAVEFEGLAHIYIYPDETGGYTVRLLRGYDLSVYEGAIDGKPVYVMPVMHEGKDAYRIMNSEIVALVNSSGEVIQADEKPIAVNNIVKISRTDFSGRYWVDSDFSLADFTIQFNAMLTELNHSVHLQSFSQPVMERISETNNEIDEDIETGKTKILNLFANRDGQTEKFYYVTPSPNLAGSIDFIKMVARMFSQSKGVSESVILGGQDKESFNSGVQRLLAMVERYENSLEYAPVMLDAEAKLFESVYKMENQDDEVPEISVSYKKPEEVKTLKERVEDELLLEQIQAQSRVKTIAKVLGVSEERAQEIMTESESSVEV